ncbi:MAG: PDZ domain-containing protein [Saprospiraceae bacterium]|nr:PDZ domain-containing protein [Saprospiraceae bacterium]MDW8484238.1 PDZ domain-containing protein [Saprospiraceae bacterium]
MKTRLILVVAALLLATAPLSAQQESRPRDEKERQKIIITKRVIEPDGTETIETIVKKGPGAEKFDIEAYRRSQGSDSVRIEVHVIETPSQERREQMEEAREQMEKAREQMEKARKRMNEMKDVQRLVREMRERMDEVREQMDEARQQLEEIDWKAIGEELGEGIEEAGEALERIFDPEDGEVGRVLRDLEGRPHLHMRGYLGVSPLEDDDSQAQGVPVNVLPGTAAERAGLKSGDIILSLDDQPIHNWDELERFMEKTKPGQHLLVRYQRGKKDATLEVELGSKIVNKLKGSRSLSGPYVIMKAEKFREKEACLGVYSSSYKSVGTSKTLQGARIESFTEVSAAREAGMREGDIITAINTQTIEDHDDLWEAIAGYRPNDRITVYYVRDNQAKQVEVSLKACRDRSTVISSSRSSEKRPPIVLRAPKEGDIPQISPLPEPAANHVLILEEFRVYPNPTTGLVTVEFQAEPKPTTVLLLDLSGRQLFREELNAFSGQYIQQFELQEFQKGTFLLVVQQGDRLFVERIILQ